MEGCICGGRLLAGKNRVLDALVLVPVVVSIRASLSVIQVKIVHRPCSSNLIFNLRTRMNNMHSILNALQTQDAGTIPRLKACVTDTLPRDTHCCRCAL